MKHQIIKKAKGCGHCVLKLAKHKSFSMDTQRNNCTECTKLLKDYVFVGKKD